MDDKTNNYKRESWDEYFMNISLQVAKRTTCLRRGVGAISVHDKHIITTGYNGAAKGIESCLEKGYCLREQLHIPSGQRHEICNAIHAEQNMIIQAAMHGVSIKGATIYSTTYPCYICAKMLVNAGISDIIYLAGYPDELSEGLLKEAKISTTKLELKLSLEDKNLIKA